MSDASSILKLLQNAGNNFAKDEDVQLELKKFNPSWALGKNKNSRKKASKVQFHQEWILYDNYIIEFSFPVINHKLLYLNDLNVHKIKCLINCVSSIK